MEEKFKEVNPGVEDNDIVELTDDQGRVLKFYHVGTLDYEKRWFAFFQPAEKIEGVEEDEVVIFEITGDEGDESLIPVEDEALLDKVYEKFCKEMEEDECNCEDECEDEHCNCGCHKKD